MIGYPRDSELIVIRTIAHNNQVLHQRFKGINYMEDEWFPIELNKALRETLKADSAKKQTLAEALKQPW